VSVYGDFLLSVDKGAYWSVHVGRIERARVLTAWTRQHLASVAHVDPKTLTDMCRERRLPNLGAVQAICNALGLSIADVIVFDDDNDQPTLGSVRRHLSGCPESNRPRVCRIRVELALADKAMAARRGLTNPRTYETIYCVAGVVVAYRRQLNIHGLVTLLGSQEAIRKDRERLDVEAVRLARALEAKRKAKPRLEGVELKYSSEEELLQHGDRMTDFLILDLVDHFRTYDRTSMPENEGVLYKTIDRDAAIVRKRRSGQVAACFAEAMCPWVFERLGIAGAASFCRVAGLAKTLWGQVLPDFVFWGGTSQVPCESKHYAHGVQWETGVTTAIAQVSAAMSVMQVAEGYVFMAITHFGDKARYEAEVVRLVA
jgi:DNA-binding XRE family transcriptional regulator